jgi:Fur family transcriptional regulator, ferric uptake regulator
MRSSSKSRSRAVKAPTEATLDALRLKLRGAGLRVTHPRLAVLRSLLRADSPMSHGDVADGLAEDGYDRVTVYRNLIDLTEVGLVRRSDHGDRTWRFELVGDAPAHTDDAHPHFICDACGVVQCLPLDAVSVRFTSKSRVRFDENQVKVQLHGRCDLCA